MALVSVRSASYLREQRRRLADQARHYKSEVTRNRARLRDTMARMADIDRELRAIEAAAHSQAKDSDPWPDSSRHPFST